MGVRREGGLTVLLLAERARSEGARSTRAIEDRPGHPPKREASEIGGRGADDEVRAASVVTYAMMSSIRGSLFYSSRAPMKLRRDGAMAPHSHDLLRLLP